MTKESKAKAKGALVEDLSKNCIAKRWSVAIAQSPTQGRGDTTNDIPLAGAEPYPTLNIIFPAGYHTAPC